MLMRATRIALARGGIGTPPAPKAGAFTGFATPAGSRFQHKLGVVVAATAGCSAYSLPVQRGGSPLGGRRFHSCNVTMFAESRTNRPFLTKMPTTDEANFFASVVELRTRPSSIALLSRSTRSPCPRDWPGSSRTIVRAARNGPCLPLSLLGTNTGVDSARSFSGSTSYFRTSSRRARYSSPSWTRILWLSAMVAAISRLRCSRRSPSVLI